MSSESVMAGGRKPVELPYEVLEQDAPTLGLLLQKTALLLWKDWPRDMELSSVNDNYTFVLNGTCPMCGKEAAFSPVTSAYVEKDEHGYNRLALAALRCIACRNYILGIIKHDVLRDSWVYGIHYPLGNPEDDVFEEIPDHIKPDFQEALRCLWVDAYNATAEMCRRALEAACIDLGASPKNVLEEMIDWLEEKRIITPGLKDVAHKVRLGGNRGAHPGQPSERIEKEHAQAIVAFSEHFFQHVYVTPKQLDKYDFSKPKKLKQ
jgi:hypothetical protein